MDSHLRIWELATDPLGPLSTRMNRKISGRSLSRPESGSDDSHRSQITDAGEDSTITDAERSARSKASDPEAADIITVDPDPKTEKKRKRKKGVRFRNDKVLPKGLNLNVKDVSKSVGSGFSAMGASIANATHHRGSKSKGWKKVRDNLPKIIQYGREIGVLVDPTKVFEAPKTEQEKQMEREKEAAEKAEKELEQKRTEGVNIPVKDVSTIHQAIPFLPLSAAFICLFLNIVAPGMGTILSGLFGMCIGFPRLQIKEMRRLVSCVINFLVGICQLGTVPILLFGWFWSIAWGAILLVHSLQYTEAMVAKRQAQVATAALEALTNDTLLRRKQVHTLVSEERKDGKKRRRLFSFARPKHGEDKS